MADSITSRHPQVSSSHYCSQASKRRHASQPCLASNHKSTASPTRPAPTIPTPGPAVTLAPGAEEGLAAALLRLLKTELAELVASLKASVAELVLRKSELELPTAEALDTADDTLDMTLSV